MSCFAQHRWTSYVCCFQNVYHQKLWYVYNSMYAKSIPFKWSKPFGELTSIKIPSRHWQSTLHGQFQNWNVPDVGHQTSQGVGTNELTWNLAIRNPTLSLHEFPRVFWNGTQPFALPFILTLKSPWGVPDYTKDLLEKSVDISPHDKGLIAIDYESPNTEPWNCNETKKHGPNQKKCTKQSWIRFY